MNQEDKMSKAREARRGKVANFTELVSRRRLPGEIPTRTSAIRNFCRECMGWNSDGYGSIASNIQACMAPECWLYPYRNGPVEEDS